MDMNLLVKIVAVFMAAAASMITIILYISKNNKTTKEAINNLAIAIAKLEESLNNQKSLNNVQDKDIRNFTKESMKTQSMLMEALSELTSKINDRSDNIYQTKEMCKERHSNINVGMAS